MKIMGLPMLLLLALVICSMPKGADANWELAWGTGVYDLLEEGKCIMQHKHR
jgi:hypothetical protein